MGASGRAEDVGHEEAARASGSPGGAGGDKTRLGRRPRGAPWALLLALVLVLTPAVVLGQTGPPPLEFPPEFPMSLNLEARVRHWVRVFAGGPAERLRLTERLRLSPPSSSASAGPAARGGRRGMRRSLLRSKSYLTTIGQTLERHWLPPLLAHLPHVESAFVPTARSHAGAYGLWQIMPATARQLGLRVDGNIDERRDPAKASETAARYLAEAYLELRSWPLAITAYNYGIAAVRKAVRSTGSRDLGELVARYRGPAFGNEVKNFYAKFLAAAHVAENADYYFPDVDATTVQSRGRDADGRSDYWRMRFRRTAQVLDPTYGGILEADAFLPRPADAWPQSEDDALARLADSLVTDESNKERAFEVLRAGRGWPGLSLDREATRRLARAED